MVVGAVLSMLTGGLFAVVVLPALSPTAALAVRPLPSPEITLSAGAEPSSPDSASAAVQCTVTSLLYQPVPFEDVVGEPDRLGATLSMLIPPTVAVAVLSALSAAVPVTDWFAALALSVVGPLHVFTPDGLSEQLKPTVTSVLFQPLTFAAGLRVPVMPGADLSSFTVTEPVPLLPSRSVAVDVFVTPAVLALTESDSGVGPLATPEPASVALQAMPTLPLFQPAALGVGATAPVTTGAALSSTYEADIGFWCCPVHPLALTFEYAVAVTVCAPLPDPAVSLNVHVDAAGPGDCRSVNPPVSSTHLVSL